MHITHDSLSTLELQDYKICYRDVGQGPIIILLHGWSLNSTYWAAQVEFLAKNYRVIAYDMRGMGCSTGGRKAFHFQALYDEAKAVIRALCGGQKPILIGHSLGGNLVLQYAIESSDQVAAIVVVDAPLPHRPQQVMETIFFKLVSEDLGLKVMASRAERALWSKKYRQTSPEAMADWRAQFCSDCLPVLINTLSAWSHRPNPLPHLDKIKVKTQLVVGEEDQIAGKDMQTLQRAFAGTQLHIIREAGHMSFVEKPDEFNRVVAPFLDTLAGV